MLFYRSVCLQPLHLISLSSQNHLFHIRLLCPPHVPHHCSAPCPFILWLWQLTSYLQNHPAHLRIFHKVPLSSVGRHTITRHIIRQESSHYNLMSLWKNNHFAQFPTADLQSRHQDSKGIFAFLSKLIFQPPRKVKLARALRLSTRRLVLERACHLAAKWHWERGFNLTGGSVYPYEKKGMLTPALFNDGEFCVICVTCRHAFVLEQWLVL